MVSARYTRETKTAFRKGGCFTQFDQFDGFGNSAMVSTRYAPRETKLRSENPVVLFIFDQFICFQFGNRIDEL